MDIQINLERLITELHTLAGFSELSPPAVTRVLYSEEDRQARAYLKALFIEAGLELREDALGNTFARWHGSQAELASVATGSHIDAIPFSGSYDGTVGVLGGLEAIRALKASGFQPQRSLELIIFTAEEPTRFGVGCLGSRAMSGVLDLEGILALKDAQGQNPDEARRQAGFGGDISQLKVPTGFYHAFVELHIEQMPQLEARGIPIGVVTAIAAPATLHISLEGEGGHAGAVLMPDRRDALVAAAEIAQTIESIALSSGSIDSVATVGILDVYPRAVNSIPSKIFMTVDVRDTDLARRDSMVEAIKQETENISAGRKIAALVEVLNADPPASCAHDIIQATELATHELGLRSLPMVSRAYHDALFMARICPTGMIFIPCKDGISHRPDEYSKPEDIACGVKVLALVLAKLSRA